MLVLPLALRYSSLNAYVIQALFAVFAVVTSYLGNKFFTFRGSGRQVPPDTGQAESASSDAEEDQAP